MPQIFQEMGLRHARFFGREQLQIQVPLHAGNDEGTQDL
jgi:hypothetical protein